MIQPLHIAKQSPLENLGKPRAKSPEKPRAFSEDPSTHDSFEVTKRRIFWLRGWFFHRAVSMENYDHGRLTVSQFK